MHTGQWVTVWIVSFIVCVIVGQRKHRPGVLYGLFGPAGVLVLLATAANREATHRECPHCREPVKVGAAVCPHCQREIDGEPGAG